MTDPFPGEPMSEHPAAELIAAYLSGTLSPPEEAALETHMAGCRPCRHEVTSARRIIRSRTSRRRWLVAATGAAAVLLLAVLIRGPQVTRPAEEPLRAGGGVEENAAPGLAAFAPADGDTVSREGLHFVWAGHEGRPLYHVTVTDPSGRALWLRETSDTALVLPPEIALDPGRTYYWYVDALDAGGGSLTTGTHRFIVAP
jgi:hypothetical protein